jgi:hypothetical protein
MRVEEVAIITLTKPLGFGMNVGIGERAMAPFTEIKQFDGVSVSVTVSGDTATLSVMGSTPILIHLPLAALPFLRRQIDAALSPPPPPSEKR